MLPGRHDLNVETRFGAEPGISGEAILALYRIASEQRFLGERWYNRAHSAGAVTAQEAELALIHGEITIDRPVEDVFDFVSDECNEPRYNPQMLSVEKLSPGPIGSGTQFRIRMTRGAPMLLEFTTFERPVRLGSHTSSSGVTIDGELTFEEGGDSTLMVWDWNITPSGALKILAPFIVWMGRRQETRIWSDLKRCLEE